MCGTVECHFFCHVIQATKLLKPDKWKTVFDVDGKALGFRKALKLIILGVR